MIRIALQPRDAGLASTLLTAGYSLSHPGGPSELSADSVDLVLVEGEVGNRWCTELRARLPQLPILAVMDDPNLAFEAIEAGATDILVRPIHPQVLRSRIASYVSSSSQQTADLLSRLLEICTEPVIVSDLSGDLLVFNPAAEHMLGYRRRDLHRLHVMNLYDDPNRARQVMDSIRQFDPDPITGFQARLRAYSGEVLHVELSACFLRDASGEPVATLGFFRDIRENLSLHERLSETTEQLIVSETRAGTVELAGAAAHELNQPLTSVMGAIEILLMREDLDEGVGRRLNQIYTQLERMARVVQNLSELNQYRTKPYVAGTHILDIKGD